jgi:hypothetical protein
MGASVPATASESNIKGIGQRAGGNEGIAHKEVGEFQAA